MPAGRTSTRATALLHPVLSDGRTDSSFYRWPRLATFRAWKRLPGAFRFSVKAPRGLTHAKKRYAPEAWIQRIAACWHELADKPAVLLVQLGPNLARDDAWLGYFLD